MKHPSRIAVVADQKTIDCEISDDCLCVQKLFWGIYLAASISRHTDSTNIIIIICFLYPLCSLNQHQQAGSQVRKKFRRSAEHSPQVISIRYRQLDHIRSLETDILPRLPQIRDAGSRGQVLFPLTDAKGS